MVKGIAKIAQPNGLIAAFPLNCQSKISYNYFEIRSNAPLFDAPRVNRLIDSRACLIAKTGRHRSRHETGSVAAKPTGAAFLRWRSPHYLIHAGYASN
jgi:hypothetical protein